MVVDSDYAKDLDIRESTMEYMFTIIGISKLVLHFTVCCGVIHSGGQVSDIDRGYKGGDLQGLLDDLGIE